MSFQNTTNESRIRKMLETIGHIETSARSNRASEEEIKALFEPLFLKLVEIGAIGTTSPDPAPTVSPGKWASDRNPPQWATVRDMAAEANLKDLTFAMAVYLNRIDEDLSGRSV